MRIVPDQAQFVVQIVFTTSSNTVGLRIHRPAPRAAQSRSGSSASSAYKRREVLVEAQHVAHRAHGPTRCTPFDREQPGEVERRTTVCGPGCSVSSSVRSTESIRFGSRSFSPCELTVRQKSTGSPPAPTSSSSIFAMALA